MDTPTVTEYFYNGDILAGQKTGNKVMLFLYDETGDYFGFTYEGHEYYYVKNAQNDVIGIAMDGGWVVAHYFYDAWGNVTIKSDTGYTIYDIPGHAAADNPIRYRSHYYDAETQWYFLSSRYYSPAMQRFLNADGVLGANQDINAYNLFAYCSNDPINFCDELGCEKISNWFKNIGSKIKEWWNSETPSSPITIPSSNSLISSISDAALGAVGKALGQIQKNIPYGSSSRGTIRGTPWQTGPKYPKAIKTVGTVSAIISIASLALDVGNTWTEQNGNTNGDRVIKTAIQFAAVGVGVGVGALAKVAFAGLTAANMPVVGAVAFAAVSVVGGILIDYASNAIYEKAGIK